MRKMLVCVFVFVFLVTAIPASAQYIPTSPDGWWYKIQRNQVLMLEADNLELINQIQRQGYRSLGPDLRWGGNAYGIPVGRGFYPMYDRDRKPISKKKAAVIYGTAGAIGGALVGRYVGPGTKKNQITSTIVGAGLGALVGALAHRDNGNFVVTPPSPRQERRVGRDGIPVAVGARPGYQAQFPEEWQMLRNEFEGVTIYARVQGADPNEPIVIPAGQTVTVQIPRGSQIWAEAQVCINDGCTVQRWRQDVGRRPLPQGAGWVFYNPEEKERR